MTKVYAFTSWAGRTIYQKVHYKMSIFLTVWCKGCILGIRLANRKIIIYFIKYPWQVLSMDANRITTPVNYDLLYIPWWRKNDVNCKAWNGICMEIKPRQNLPHLMVFKAVYQTITYLHQLNIYYHCYQNLFS